jgi:MFS family permease
MTRMSETHSPIPSVASGYMPKQRLAVSGLFLMHGLFMGAWAPKIPESAARLGLTPSTLGMLIFAFGIGSLIMMPIAGIQIAKHGSAVVSKVGALLFATTMLLVTLAPNVPAGAVAVFLLGGLAGAFDVGMNSNAVEVEKAMKRSIMSSCHGYWSVGAFIGSSTGGILIEQIGVLGHTLVLTAVAVSILAVSWPIIMPDQPHAAHVREKLKLPTSPLPWLIGIMALFSMIPEGAVLDWGALYLRNELNASIALSGFAFGSFALTMSIMRFGGDYVRDWLGAVKTLQICTVLAIVGMGLAAIVPDAYVAILGFGIAGLGISNMVPIAFSAAGNLPGYAKGVALSVVTFLGYSGALFVPSIIGFIAERTGFQTIYLGLPLLLLVVLLLSPLAKHADNVKSGGVDPA